MSNLGFSRSVALRYLWSRRSEAAITIITVISVLGVAIGVIVLNMVMAVMTGFQVELREKIVGADAHITVRALGGKIQEWPAALQTVEKVEGVVSASPFTQHQALLKSGDRSAGLLIKGIAPKSASAIQVQGYLPSDLSVDKLFEGVPTPIVTEDGEEGEAQLPAILVGRELARNLGIYPGTVVSLLSPQVSSSPFGLLPRFRRFAVVGTYKSGLVEYENGLAYVALEEAQRFFKSDDVISGIEVRVQDLDHSAALARRIVDALGGAGQGFYAQDWTEANRAFFEAMNLEKKVYFIVLLLIIVMASFSIVSSLVMVVLEKRKDIAVLKTLGASNRSIANIFRIQGSVIGAVGVTLGLVGGYAGCVALKRYGFPIDERIFQMSTLPVHIDPWNFLIVGVAAFLICCVATIYPARRASVLEPTEILRFE